MRIQIKELRYWKTEHQDLENCQDAYKLDPSKGLFVVADGAGTTLFPAIWARILVEHFVNIPLMTSDPFEVDWWVRLAQNKYKTSIPDMAALLDWSIRQKAMSESSDSTLATVRISASDASSAQAELLVFGDSCVIIGNKTTQKIESFVLEDAAQFAQPPICIPSLLRFFNHHFHRCSIKNMTLGSEHIVILASDAVSKWIVGGGSGRFIGDTSAWEAFQTISSLAKESWPAFIESCREAKEMVNDDCTALILTLKAEDMEEGVSPEDMPLGKTDQHTDAIIQERKTAFEKAFQEQNNELVAIYYGDGKDIGRFFPQMAGDKIEHARRVADALQSLLRAFRQAQNKPGLAAKMQQVWQRYGPTLENEKCAENIRETLRSNGVNLSLKEPESPKVQVALAPVPLSEAPTDYSSPPRSVSQLDPQALATRQNEQEKKDLERAYLIAYSAYDNMEEEDKKENYESLLKATDALESARPRYPDIYSFTPRQEESIALARRYKQAMDALRKVLCDGLVAQIDAAYNPTLISDRRLNANELKQIQLARSLTEAFRSDNDETILVLDWQIQTSDNRRFFNFTQEEQERIDLAQRRKDALKAFQDFLKAGRLRQIVNVYDPILDNSKELSESERAWLHLATEFVRAYDDDNDTAIVAAYEKIKQFSYADMIAFTQPERKRIQQAEEKMKWLQTINALVVAKVKGQDITLGQVRKVGIVTKSLSYYWIERYQLEIATLTDLESKRNKEQQIAGLQASSGAQQLVNKALDYLIHDVLIKTKETEDKPVENPLDEANREQLLLSQLESFQKVVVSDYQAFLKRNTLTDKDVKDALQIFLRYKLFRPYFENQQKSGQRNIMSQFKKPLSLEDWLERQRKDVVYMHSSNAEQRALWLADELGWKESA